jgi:8-oxo-dGTP pyrophosphatase MutT (NUDIX family)
VSDAAAVPRLAASVIVLRGGDRTLEILLVQRTADAAFMAGAWVFPGGSVDPGDGSGEAALRSAALRELEEEASIRLAGPDELIAYSHWITPPRSRIRFDTWFFLAAMPAGQTVAVDGAEIVDARWYAPRDALAVRQREALGLVLPTISHLEQLAAFPSVSELLAHARGRPVQPLQPPVAGSPEHARIVLPGEPGHV